MAWQPLDSFPPETRLLVLGTRPAERLVPPDALRPVIEEVREWDKLVDLGYEHRVRQLLYRNLVQMQQTPIPEDVAARLHQHSFASGARNLLLSEALHEVVDALHRREVDVLCLKGLALSALAHGDTTCRGTGDIDLLVRRGDFETARDALVSLGYVPDVKSADEAEFLEEHHGYAFRSAKADVDLHWNVAHLFQRIPTDFDALWSRATRVRVGRGPVQTLSPEDQLLQLTTHAVTHCWRMLYLITDIAALLSRVTDFDWDYVVRTAHSQQSRRAVALGIYLAHRFYDTPLPPVLRDEISGPAVERLAAQVQHWLLVDDTLSHDRFVIHRFYLRSLDGWQKRLQYVWDMMGRGIRNAVAPS